MAIEKTINLNVNTKDAQKEVKNLEKAVEGVNEEVKETSASTEQMGGALDSATGGAISKFNGLKGTLKGVVKSFKTLRVAIIATGIGALLIAVTSLGQAFTRSEEGQNKFAKILGVIGSVVDNLLDLLANLGESIISVFENPKQAIKDFANLIKQNITNRFEGLLELIPNLAKAVSLLFKGEFKEAGKVATDAVGKVVLGVDSVTDSVNGAIEAVKEFGKEVASDAENAAKIADARAKAEKMARNLIVERAEAERKIAEIREKAADKENFTAAERIELLKEAGAISEDLANKESEVARIRLEAIELENSLAKSNKQALDDEANARAQVIQLETNRLRLQKALTAEVTTAIRENNAEQKALADQKAAEEKEFIKEMIAAEQELVKEEEAAAKAKIDLDKKVKDAKIANAEAVSGAIGTLAGIAGEGTAAGKALGVASATIDTYVGANKAIAQGGIAGVAQAIAIIATGLTNVKTILSTKVPKTNVGGVSVGGGGGGGGAQVQAPSFNIVGASDTNQLADAIGGQTQQPVQAFVVANDVTTAQSLENNIVEGATL
jgi:actin-related protein